ncbi:hypothetical protein, partial [Pseudomonas aeruginosa]|uniref:hypothetical protein n=1 Tax=Pseudomonas aeruginosa TaxID=287 RepID=UPI001F4AB9DE
CGGRRKTQPTVRDGLTTTEAISTLVGVLVFCVGSATNPYFSGFDSLFLLGFIPLIASVGKVYAHS